jgi:DEAD/DEAH box helicase domain-containing protein
MNSESHIPDWKTDPTISGNITAWKVIPARKPIFIDLPEIIDPKIRSLLSSQGITNLYQHQQTAWDLVQSGKNLVLATGTASGKSLAYQLPILNALSKNRSSKALLLFPTKALARDQLAWLNEFSFANTFAYDGDTPQHQRRNIRHQADLIITNPDMLHLGILPYHTNWIDFISQLKFVVLDEIHVYRGVFGSHVANVIRRLKRLCAHYGAQPQFILTSATIGNPLELAESLIEEKIELVAEDTSARGEKHFLLYNPPVIDPKLGLRASMVGEAIRLSAEIIQSGLQTILFGRSRRSVEFMLSALQKKVSLPPSALKAYRSGYLPADRRKIERDLRSGKIRGICATTALELGIDIGGLDSTILAGYPGTIAGTWQQAGRSGRLEEPSISVLVASSNPLDQYLIQHPEFIFDSNPEDGLVDPDNLLIALSHLQCAAYELPFEFTDNYGNFSVSQTMELLTVLNNSGKLHISENRYFWMSEEYPAAAVSLRTTSMDQILLEVSLDKKERYILGTIDYESAMWMVHPGAIYLHAGEIYQVEDLDLQTKKAYLVQVSDDYYTEAEKQTGFSLIRLGDEHQVAGGKISHGELLVSSQVTGYKKIRWDDYQVLGKEQVDLPATDLNTMGFWIEISADTEESLRNSGLWTSSPNDYGPDWESIRRRVLERDRRKCNNCGKQLAGETLHVHHKQPLRIFPGYREANHLSNLVTLCPRCHQRAEAIVRVNSGIRGLGYIFHSLAPLLLMCDPGDLGLYTDFRSPLGSSRPIAMLYEQIPAGIGFSSRLFQRYSVLLKMAFQAVHDCTCQNGCPSCVGPGGELGSGGKVETLAMLSALNLDQQTTKIRE